MYILVVGLNHKTAPVAVRETFSFSENQKKALYRSFRETCALENLMILSTCNRTELYAVTRDLPKGEAELYACFLRQGGHRKEDVQPFLYCKACDEAVLHLYRVASGLDSMIVGETQILGQLKGAYAEAKAQGASGRVMNQLMQKAFAVGKKVRSITKIDQHPVSVSYVAVEQARRQSGGLAGKKVLVVGAGEAGQLAARYLKEDGVQAIFVSNRSETVAQRLAQELEGVAVRFDALPQYLAQVDIIISCTGANHWVIHGPACREALVSRGGRPLWIVDIAVPRDVDPVLREIEGVTLWDMDGLQKVILESEKERQAAARMAETLVQEEMQAFRAWSAALHVTPVIAALKAGGQEVLDRELTRALNRLGRENLTEREQRVMTEMGQAIVNQLLRAPVEGLKRLAEEGQGETYAAALRRLWNLTWTEEGQEDGTGESAAVSHRDPRQ